MRLPAILAALLCLMVLPARAIDLVDVANPDPTRDIGRFLAGLETDQREISIERPDSHTELRTNMNLVAKGPGPVFRWVAAGFRNSGTEPREVVIAIPDQGFVGSGIRNLKRLGPRVVSVTTTGVGEVELLPQVGKSAFTFTMEPGTTGAIAFEINEGYQPEVVLWHRDAFDSSKDYLSFFRGALLGIALLLAVALLALYGFRSRAVFPAAGCFALSCVAFMMLEAGHVPPILAAIGLEALNLQVARAIIEGLMAATLILLLGTLSELHRVTRLGANLLMITGGLAFAVPIYGFAEPELATFIARVLFMFTAIAGFLLIFGMWRRGEVKADQALVSWAVILLWSFFAMVAAASPANDNSLSPILLAGLCAVLVVLAFTLAHYAFSQGYLSRHFFREAGRHALALAGARTYVWDWQPEDGELFVSPEIETALAQPSGIMSAAAAEAFIELMHPSDRAVYLAAVEDAGLDGRIPIEKEFRLRHGDGTYRWFQLRARAIAGQGQRVARCIGTLADVTSAKLAEERLLSDAVYDLVTGLPNRALFVDRLSRAMSGPDVAAHAALYVFLVDLDRFKLVNDAMGHDAGDALLAVVGRRLRTETGPADSVARLPGDQFAILFTEHPEGPDVVAFAGAILKSVARPITIDGQEYFLTASIGIAQMRDDEVAAEQLMKDAALALYEAKRRGAQSIEVFSPAMRDDRAELVVLESELRRAIERNEIEVHYQPIARLADLQLAGFEALVRWRHPVLGLLAPESFIGLAEQTGMIIDIGRTVLNEAGRQLGIWQRAYRQGEPVFVAVNISSAQLIEAGLIDEVKQVLHREGLSRGSLKIEVTESLVMQYPERASQILQRLRELGVGIACDDFGTGYSSLSSLRKLPFDTLKVDRSFIASEAQDARAFTILESIIAMAHALGLSIVAEGIENQDQVDRLGALDCDYGQGYFIGKPLSAKQVNEALAGLPYASASGRTAITWLWERAFKDPPPTPVVRQVTADDIASEHRIAAAQQAEAQAAAPSIPRRAAPEAPIEEPVPVLEPDVADIPVDAETEAPSGEEPDVPAVQDAPLRWQIIDTEPDAIEPDAESVSAEDEAAEPDEEDDGAEVPPSTEARPRKRKKRRKRRRIEGTA